MRFTATAQVAWPTTFTKKILVLARSLVLALTTKETCSGGWIANRRTLMGIKDAFIEQVLIQLKVNLPYLNLIWVEIRVSQPCIMHVNGYYLHLQMDLYMRKLLHMEVNQAQLASSLQASVK